MSDFWNIYFEHGKVVATLSLKYGIIDNFFHALWWISIYLSLNRRKYYILKFYTYMVTYPFIIFFSCKRRKNLASKNFTIIL